MEVTQAQYDAFIAQRDEAAKVLGTQTLTNNPNVTYGQILSPQELGSAAIIFSPELNAGATEIFDADTLNKILKENGIIIIHRHKKEIDTFPKKFNVIDKKKYGISKIIFGSCF